MNLCSALLLAMQVITPLLCVVFYFAGMGRMPNRKSDTLKLSRMEMDKCADHIDEGGREIPNDFYSPRWDKAGASRDWMRYTTAELRRVWPVLSVDQKEAVAEALNIIAKAELEP